jgi:hypothetical protein
MSEKVPPINEVKDVPVKKPRKKRTVKKKPAKKRKYQPPKKYRDLFKVYHEMVKNKTSA